MIKLGLYFLSVTSRITHSGICLKDHEHVSNACPMDACVCARAGMHACPEHYTGVCGCISVEEAGQASGERM